MITLKIHPPPHPVPPFRIVGVARKSEWRERVVKLRVK